MHVPIELLEQWSSHSHTLREAIWFRALFTQVQLAKLAAFDATVSLNKRLLGKRVPDVPEIFSVPAWLAMVEAAASTIAFVPSSDDLDDRDGS